MRIARMKKGQWGKVRAFFDLEIEGFTIKGFKLIEGSEGMFVGFPSQKDKEGNYNSTVFAGKELKEKLTYEACEHYKIAVEDNFPKNLEGGAPPF